MTAFTVVVSQMDMSVIKKTFLAMSAATLAFIPMDIAAVHLESRRLRSVSASSLDPREPGQAAFESLASYEAALEKSVLFGVYHPKEALPVFKSSIHELAKDYRLKGVILMKDSEAIIEDARIQQSSFVRVGDALGELRVEEIKESSVIVSYYGEKKELTLP